MLPGQVSVCEQLADDESCSYQGEPNGICIDKVCLPAGCGNFKLEEGEVCDDGNRLHGDGCSADCLSNETCGNGIIDQTVGESCDDDGPDCRDDCVSARCGDGVVDEASFEVCDDPNGNSNEADAACRTNCQLQRCGDGVTDFLAGEDCDDGNVLPGDACSDSCQFEVCGNGIIDVDFVDGSFRPKEDCDDGNGLNHDGCAASCQSETPRWEARNGAAPPLRHSSGMAYDVNRDRTVLFGGFDGSFEFNDTWEWDGKRWIKMHPVNSPEPRFAAGTMAYDPVRKTILLFGGSDQLVRFTDTWEWNGTDWKKLPVAGPLPGGGRLVHDLARNEIMFFGVAKNSTNSTFFNETWKWNGLIWVQVFPATIPPVGTLAYNPKLGKIVLFTSPFSEKSRAGETWEWDGIDWMQMSPKNSPPARFSTALAYDAASELTLLFGGMELGGVRKNDTWVWDGTDWTQRTPDTSPSERFTDVSSSSLTGVVLFGGNPVSGDSNDTWVWNGNDWLEQTTNVASPDVRSLSPGFSMEFDAGNNKVVLVGRQPFFPRAFVTWLWDGSYWEEQTPVTSIVLGENHNLVYDSKRDRVLLFNNRISSVEVWAWDGQDWIELTSFPLPSSVLFPSNFSSDMAYDADRDRVVLLDSQSTWEWDGVDWAEMVTTLQPISRIHHALAYDNVRKQVLLFGGISTGGEFFDDTWSWDGTVWVELEPVSSPLPIFNHTMEFNAATGRILLFGGEKESALLGIPIVMDETWEWDGNTWNETPTLDSTVLQDHVMAYDSVNGQMVVLGEEPFGENLKRTQTFQFTAGIRESCTTGFDGDDDGLIGCADPDCWGRCMPECPPFSTPNWPSDCDLTRPHCGDGVCNNFLETPRLCPSDCGAPTLVCGDFHCDVGESIVSCPGDCTL